ncbi:glycosyltransferase [Candidatus Shapirobacteria bacterium]|nr:glycosyltransferase [Candidatus Shapirobacteria bacterium]
MTYDLIVVSSYPRLGTTRDKFTVGVADCTKQTLTSLPSETKILVLAEYLPDENPLIVDKNVTINRIWQRNSVGSFLKIFKEIQKHGDIPVLLEFEMAMYGNPVFNIFFVKLLFALKLASRKTYIVLHQVVTDFSEISGHIGNTKDSPINGVLNILAKSFYKLVILFSTKIIVFEQFLKNRLDQNNPKIVVIPHGVEPQTIIQPPKKENLFTITVFGYLAWYKGTDWIIKAFSNYFDKHPNSKFKLVVAGGPNPNHLDKPYYQKYLSEIDTFSSKHPSKIIVTGYVPESEIKKYYLESDLIVLPYRVGMSSSGPIAIAYAYHKPFLVSPKISQSLDTPDINQLVNKQMVKFSFEPKKLFQKLNYLSKHPQELKKMSVMSQDIAIKRSWINISQHYKQCLGL